MDRTMIPRGKGRPPKNSLPDARDLLISATRELLRTQSPDQMNRIGIAKLAGVDPGLVRYYFGDKEELLRQTAMRMLSELRERRALARQDHASIRGKLASYVKFLVEALHEYPFLHDLLVRQIGRSGTQEASALRREFVESPFQEVETLLRDAIAGGELRPVNTQFFYVAMIGMCSFPMRNRAVMRQVLGHAIDLETAAHYAEFVADLLLRGIHRDDAGEGFSRTQELI